MGMEFSKKKKKRETKQRLPVKKVTMAIMFIHIANSRGHTNLWTVGNIKWICPMAPGTSGEVSIWDEHGPSRICTCAVVRACGPLGSTWDTFLGKGKSGD